MPILEKCPSCAADLTPEERKKNACSHCGAVLDHTAQHRAVEDAIKRHQAVREALAAEGKEPSDNAHENAKTLERHEGKRKAERAAPAVRVEATARPETAPKPG